MGRKWTLRAGNPREGTAIEAASSPKNGVSVTMDTTGLTRGEALQTLERIEKQIRAGDWPPVIESKKGGKKK